jgi:decaprenylphospho-beta-D-ribofuranose 2-oxidase
MHTKKIVLTNFSRAVASPSFCIRPDNEHQLIEHLSQQKPQRILTRGSGLSYSDCCLNTNHLVINTQHLNHFISFDKTSGIVVCQAGVTFYDLLHLDPEFIPPVLPGTLHATLAGGIANDVHGKNNPHAKSLGHHIVWMMLLINDNMVYCNRVTNSDLFYATIAGVGLTGIIIRLAIRLKKASHFVQAEYVPHNCISSLVETMTTQGFAYDYQVAWLDLLRPTPRAVVSWANHCPDLTVRKKKRYSVPKLPFSLINTWNMSWFNNYYFNHQPKKECLSLEEFNNPLDKISHWNHLYGKKGVLQFQAVFPQEYAVFLIGQFSAIIKKNNATPTLSVLKLFTQPGDGLLSFCMPGLTLAIDFINNPQATKAIIEMNSMSSNHKSRIYLAKDLLLTAGQYKTMYEHHDQFSKIVKKYQSPMCSDLAQRLEIIS